MNHEIRPGFYDDSREQDKRVLKSESRDRDERRRQGMPDEVALIEQIGRQLRGRNANRSQRHLSVSIARLRERGLAAMYGLADKDK